MLVCRQRSPSSPFQAGTDLFWAICTFRATKACVSTPAKKSCSATGIMPMCGRRGGDMNSALSPLRFDVPTLIHGGGSRAGLPQIVRELGGSRVLLVTDEGVVARGGAQEIVAILEGAGLAVAVFDRVQPDPTDENVAAGVAA